MWTSADRFAPTDAADDGAFDLPTLDAFPRHAEPTERDERDERDALAPFPSFPTHDAKDEAEDDAFAHGDAMSFDEQRSVHSDEFVDAEAYMADHRPGEDSFLREVSGGEADADWAGDVEMDNASDRRASAIFVPKSRNMERVEFSSPKQTLRKGISSLHEAPLKMHIRANTSNQAGNTAFSATNTAISSDYDIHVDNRLILTPNTFKILQQRERQPTEDFSLLYPNDPVHDSTGVSHSAQAKQVVDARATANRTVPSVPGTPARPSSAEKAMHAGPGMIKKALHELESMLQSTSFDDGDSDPEFDPALEKLRSKLRQIPPQFEFDRTDFADEATGSPSSTMHAPYPHEVAAKPEMRSEGVQADRSPVSDASVQAINHSHDRQRQSEPRIQGSESRYERSAIRERGAMRISSLRSQAVKPHVNDGNPGGESDDVKVTSQPARQVRTVDAWTQPEAKAADAEPGWEETLHNKKPARPKETRPETSFRRASLRESVEAQIRTGGISDRENVDVNLSARIRTQTPFEQTRLRAAQGEMDREHTHTQIKATVNSLPLATAVPSRVARRCRRILCAVGERMYEQIVFSNGSTKVGRICVSLLPLSTGCQQFSVSPAVLELQPRSRSAFTVTFEALRPGVVAGIFQFRAVGVDGLFEPYEVLIEASVRGDLQLPPVAPRAKSSKPVVRGIKSISQENRVTELPAQALAGVKITPTFLRFSKASDNNGRDVVTGGSSIRISNTTAESVHYQLKSSYEHLQLSQTRGQIPAGSEVKVEVNPICRPFGLSEDAARDWCGSMTVVVGDVLSREVSIVIDRNALTVLPTFDEAARARQAISTQTDSFYYTKKVNRRGLYFHARAVECGSCVVGEPHQVPVYICNGSDAPMTVFLQALQEPFSCEYQPTTLQARKFIEVPVTFRPKASGKVATCLVAYTVSGKAAVTLIARGIDKAAAAGREEN